MCWDGARWVLVFSGDGKVKEVELRLYPGSILSNRGQTDTWLQLCTLTDTGNLRTLSFYLLFL